MKKNHVTRPSWVALLVATILLAGSAMAAEGEVQGDFEGEGEDVKACSLPESFHLLVLYVFPYVDMDNSGSWSEDETQRLAGPFTDQLFAFFEFDNDGQITLDELFVPTFAPIEVLPLIDTNGDGVVSFDEAAGIMDPALFDALDRNGNGVLDCKDLEPPSEGEVPVPDCDLARALAGVFRLADANGDWEVTREEYDNLPLGAPLFDITPLFDLVDKNQNGAISARELLHFLAERCFEPVHCELVSDLLAHFADYDADENGEIGIGEVVFIAIFPQPNLDRIFAFADRDSSGGLSPAELRAFLARVCDDAPPPNFCDLARFFADHFRDLDHNDDLNVTRGEIENVLIDIALPDFGPLFAAADQNNDGALSLTELMRFLHQYCGDDPGRPYCEFVPIVADLFPLLDENQDGAITFDEVLRVIATTGFVFDDIRAFFDYLDIDGNQRVTREEVARRLAQCDGTGEGEVEGQQEGDLDDHPVFIRRTAGNGTYVPGGEVVFTTVINALHPDRLSALGLAESIPAGWSLKEVRAAEGAQAVPDPGATGTLEFAWVDLPSFPVTVIYVLNVPENAAGTVAIVGQALYRTTTSGEMATDAVVTPLGEQSDGARPHSADSDGDWSVSLSEVLRVIQFFNLDGYGCAGDTEDGYVPAGTNHDCAPHDSDYNTQDWDVNLSELLRLVQLYNSPASAYYGDGAGEDGYAPRVFGL